MEREEGVLEGKSLYLQKSIMANEISRTNKQEKKKNTVWIKNCAGILG